MPVAPKSEAPHLAVEEDRIAAALVGRGLVTREEVQQCRAESPAGQPILERLVAAGFLTASQAKRLAADVEQLATQQIPGYQILQRLGQGSMGIVFKARQLSMNRLVAI